MITCHRIFLEQRCRQSGYTLEEVEPCVVSRDGDVWQIDETHAAYPLQVKVRSQEGTANKKTGLPGTELKKLLSRIGITAKPNCSCNRRAKTMDDKGVEWCEKNIEVIVGWLREEATRRRLPFVDIAGRTIVKMAITRARRSQK